MSAVDKVTVIVAGLWIAIVLIAVFFVAWALSRWGR